MTSIHISETTSFITIAGEDTLVAVSEPSIGILTIGMQGPPGTAGSGMDDGDRGDIIISGGGTVWTIDNGAVSNSKLASGIDAIKIGAGSVSNTEFGYLDGVTSALQTQLDAKQAADATLTALAAYNTNGILTQTATDSFTGRTLTGTANQVTVTNGNGVSGNPTFSLPQDIATSSTPQFGKIGLGAAAVSTQAVTAVAGTASDKGVVVKGAASQTGNLAEFQNSSGVSFLTVGPDSLSGTSTTSNFLNLTATMPSGASVGVNAVNMQLSTGGSSTASLVGLNLSLLSGYAGSGTTAGYNIVNSVAGTGATYAAASSSNSYRLNAYNAGAQLTANATTSGMNCALRAMAHLSSTANYASWNTATSSGNSAALNVGTASFALNATTNCAGFFALGDYGTSAPSFSNSALIADNGATTGAIATLRDNGTAVFTVADGGVVTHAASKVQKLRTVTAAGAVTVSATSDYIIEINKSSGAATTVNLPASPATGLTFVIKDGKFDAATNNITLTPAAGTIDNAASYVMNRNGQSATITYNGTQWIIV